MAYCKDCVHWDLCEWSDRGEIMCSDFKNKADFVEVVRCKYCKHYNQLRGTCEHAQWEDAECWDRDVKTTDYCSYGERTDEQ